MDENKQKIDQIEEKLKKMPKKAQRAILWMFANLDVADQLIEGEKLSETELRAIMEAALEKEDYLLLALTLYKQAKDQNWSHG